MEDPANIRNATKSSDEKEYYKDSVDPLATWVTSAANATRFISKKLLAWGVEARGAYRISTSELDRA
jgi:hypothetical protein